MERQKHSMQMWKKGELAIGDRVAGRGKGKAVEGQVIAVYNDVPVPSIDFVLMRKGEVIEPEQKAFATWDEHKKAYVFKGMRLYKPGPRRPIGYPNFVQEVLAQTTLENSQKKLTQAALYSGRESLKVLIAFKKARIEEREQEIVELKKEIEDLKKIDDAITKGINFNFNK